MRIENFIESFHPAMREYCPVVICEDGNIFECTAGHLQMLIGLSGDSDILKKVPKDVSPLLYLANLCRCIIVDYENQIYMGKLSDKQLEAIDKLDKAGLIKKKLLKMNEEALHI